MPHLLKGRYRVRTAHGADDLRRAQALRHAAFRGGEGLDRDRFDAICTHVMIEEAATGALAGCFRILPLARGAEIGRSYSAQFYGLGALQSYDGSMVEMGRFCIAPGYTDPDILRAGWAAMTRYVDDHEVAFLFGCTSFRGTDAGSYRDSFALLGARHLAPRRWLPRIKAPAVVRFGDLLRRHVPDMKRAMLGLPPLLRSYLLMGGWVSDHAVIDRELDTLHVFTGVEVRAIPAARQRLLRAAAQ